MVCGRLVYAAFTP
ncbi:hypothetical protein LOR95_22130 [Vibrio vulnificus]|nr:hypothetical protein [Vibrio vulnificus]